MHARARKLKEMVGAMQNVAGEHEQIYEQRYQVVGESQTLDCPREFKRIPFESAR